MDSNDGGYEVFISHSSADAELANSVCQAVESRGYKCWIAPRDVPKGIRYEASIIKAIKWCPVLLVVCTTNVNDSEYVVDEISAARKRNKKIIPLLFDDTMEFSESLELHLSRFQGVKLSNGLTEEAVDEIVDGFIGLQKRSPIISENVSNSPVPEPSPSVKEEEAYEEPVPVTEKEQEEQSAIPAEKTEAVADVSSEYILEVPSIKKSYKGLKFEIKGNHAILKSVEKGILRVRVPDKIMNAGSEYPVTDINFGLIFAPKIKWIVLPRYIEKLSNLGDEIEFIDANNTVNFASQGGVVYSKDFKKLIRYPTFRDAPVFQIPEGVEEITENALFSLKRVGTIKFPKTLKKINPEAILIPVPHFELDPDNENFCLIDGALFDKNRSTLIRCPRIYEKPYRIPEGTKIIARNAFSCSNPSQIIIPNTVETICSGAFGMCDKVQIVIPETVTTIEHGAFYECSKKTIQLPLKFKSRKDLF